MDTSSNIKALVIGGSGSLGSEICKHMASKNYDLFFTYNQNKTKANALLKELEPQCKISCETLDLNDIDAIVDVVQQADEFLGGINALVIPSGLATGHEKDGQPFVPAFLETTIEDYDKMMSVNVRGIFFVCQEVIKRMVENNSGKIVIIGSIDGVKPVPAPIDYACCKAALWGLTQALSKEFGKHNILVNMIAPGILEGGLASLLSDDLMKEYLKHSSLKRVGKFSEIAKMTSFLTSEKNTYVTGQAVILDGGL